MEIFKLDIAQTVAVAAVLLALGEWIKNRVPLLSRYFIPGPIIGGLVFSIVALIGHQTGTFEFQFYDTIRNFLLLVFLPPSDFRPVLSCLKKAAWALCCFCCAPLSWWLSKMALALPWRKCWAYTHSSVCRQVRSRSRAGTAPRLRLGRC